MLSRLFLVLGAAPVLAPTVGGELLRFTSWRGIFALLAAYGALMVFLGWLLLRETLPVERRISTGVRGTLRGYRALFRDRAYVGLVVVVGLTMAGLLSYVSGSPFVYQEQFGLEDRKSTRLNSSHANISYAVFCLKKKKITRHAIPKLLNIY